jgi:hypothetical protein
MNSGNAQPTRRLSRSRLVDARMSTLEAPRVITATLAKLIEMN